MISRSSTIINRGLTEDLQSRVLLHRSWPEACFILVMRGVMSAPPHASYWWTLTKWGPLITGLVTLLGLMPYVLHLSTCSYVYTSRPPVARAASSVKWWSLCIAYPRKNSAQVVYIFVTDDKFPASGLNMNMECKYVLGFVVESGTAFETRVKSLALRKFSFFFSFQFLDVPPTATIDN